MGRFFFRWLFQKGGGGKLGQRSKVKFTSLLHPVSRLEQGGLSLLPVLVKSVHPSCWDREFPPVS